MIDNDMTNILKNFDSADSGTGTVTDAKTGEQKVSTAAAEKNAMKSLLEGLDSAQKSVNQMPATHTMAKDTGAKHPANKFLVGGEFEDEVNLSQDQVDLSKYQAQTMEAEPAPEITNTPTIQPGMNVHVGHHLPGASGVEGEVVRIEDDKVVIRNPDGKMYRGQLKNTTVSEARVEEDTIAQPEAPKQQMNKKQSLADLFRSMDETEEDMAGRFKKELHDEKASKTLSKNDSGKFNLAEEEGEFGVFLKGGSLGEWDKTAKKTFPTKEEAKAFAKRRNSQLSPGEKKHYKMRYVVRPMQSINEDEELGWGDEMIEDIKLLLQDSAEDRRIDLREELIKLIATYER